MATKREWIQIPKAEAAYLFGMGTPDAEAGRKIKTIVREAVGLARSGETKEREAKETSERRAT